MNLTYRSRWKEMLDGFYGPHQFTVEMTLGELHVFFPTEERWNRTAPAWAQGLWKKARDGAEAWGKAKSIPFSVDPGAWVDFQSGK